MAARRGFHRAMKHRSTFVVGALAAGWVAAGYGCSADQPDGVPRRKASPMSNGTAGDEASGSGGAGPDTAGGPVSAGAGGSSNATTGGGASVGAGGNPAGAGGTAVAGN